MPSDNASPLPVKGPLSSSTERLLCAEERRLVPSPILYPKLWDMYLKARASFWTESEIDLSNDLVHWDALNEHERRFLSHVLAFFAASDGIVNINLAERFGRELVQLLEAQYFYRNQQMMEDIHALTYSRLIETYIRNPEERTRMLNAVETVPCVQRKAAWAFKWIEDKESNFATRLVAFAVVEGVFFSGSFCAIFWMKKRQLMPGLCMSNELISRDEGMHQDFAAMLYKDMIQDKLPEATVHAIVREAVHEEVNFCTEALPVSLIGMNATDMAQYIRFVADRLLTQLGVSKLWNVSNPFDWMELLSLEGKTNFFERRVSEYQKAGAGVGAENAHEFSTDAEF